MMPITQFVSRILKKSGLYLSKVADGLYVSPRNQYKKEFEQKDLEQMLKTSFSLTTTSVVIDVGGYRGDWASDIYSRYRCPVFVLEPVIAFCQHLRTRFSQNPDIQIIQAGLGAQSGEQSISLQADGTSFFRATDVMQTVRMKSAKDFFAEEQLTEIDLIKMNIEGSEYELLEHLIAIGMVPHIRHFLIQFHDISPDSYARMQKIRKELSKTHRPLFQYDFIWEAWTKL